MLAEAGESIDRFLASGVLELGAKLGPINWQFAATKKFNLDDFAAFLKLLPKRIGDRSLRHAVEVRHESFANADFVKLARSFNVAIVTAGDSEFPEIADVTAPFVYVRIMGSKEKEKLGYSGKRLGDWAASARAWADGSAPKEFATLTPTPKSTNGRDVFLYVISGFKDNNPTAAMALIQRLS